MTTPATNEPNNAWTPIRSVTRAEAKRNTRMAAMTVLSPVLLSGVLWLSHREMSGFIQNNMIRTNASTSTIVIRQETGCWALTTAMTNARIVQAVTSLVAAH